MEKLNYYEYLGIYDNYKKNKGSGWSYIIANYSDLKDKKILIGILDRLNSNESIRYEIQVFYEVKRKTAFIETNLYYLVYKIDKSSNEIYQLFSVNDFDENDIPFEEKKDFWGTFKFTGRVIIAYKVSKKELIGIRTINSSIFIENEDKIKQLIQDLQSIQEGKEGKIIKVPIREKKSFFNEIQETIKEFKNLILVIAIIIVIFLIAFYYSRKTFEKGGIRNA